MFFNFLGKKKRIELGDFHGAYLGSKNTAHNRMIVRYKRRIISVPLYAIMFLIYISLAPLLLLIAFTVGLVKGSFNYFRVVLFFLVFFVFELLAFLLGTLMDILYYIPFSETTHTNIILTFQNWWGAGIVTFGLPLLGGYINAVGIEELTPESGPYLLLLRHSSFGDTVLGQKIFSSKFECRYVVKKELLWDLALDFMGSKSPNFYLHRTLGKEDMAKQINDMSHILDDYHPGANIMTYLWPEGTRFTPSIRAKLVEKLAEKAKGPGADDYSDASPLSPKEVYQLAQDLQHTLPPRLSGAFALLDKLKENGGSLLFVPHYGMDKIRDFWSLMDGALEGVEIRMEFMKVSASEIPDGRRDRALWLADWWRKIDRWVADEIKRREDAEKTNKVKVQ